MTMKRGRKPDDEDVGGGVSETASKKSRQEHIHNDSHMTQLLKDCLQKVCELQAELACESDEEDDAEAAGYAACAVETLRFLAAEGLPPDHPVVTSLSQRLLRQGNER